MKSLDVDTVSTNFSAYGCRRVAIEFTGGYHKHSKQMGATCKVVVPYGSFAKKLQSIHRLGGKVINVSIFHSNFHSEIAKVDFEQANSAPSHAIAPEEIFIVEPQVLIYEAAKVIESKVPIPEENIEIEPQALIPEEIPAIELQALIPEEIPAIELQALIPEEIPVVELQALIPEEIPVVESQALIPEEVVALEPQAFFVEEIPVVELPALIPEEIPVIESQTLIPEEIIAIAPEQISVVETPQTLLEEVVDISTEQAIEKSVVESLEINVEVVSPEIADKVVEEVPVIAPKKSKAVSESTTKPKKSKASAKVNHGFSKQKDLSEVIQSHAIAETVTILEHSEQVLEPIPESIGEIAHQPVLEPEQATIAFAEIISEPVADIVLDEIVAPIIEIIPAQEPEPIVEILPEIIVEKSIETVLEPITDEIIEPIIEPVSANIAEIIIEENTSTPPPMKLIESTPPLSKSKKTKTSSKSGHGFNKSKNDTKTTRKPKS